MTRGTVRWHHVCQGRPAVNRTQGCIEESQVRAMPENTVLYCTKPLYTKLNMFTCYCTACTVQHPRGLGPQQEP